MATAIAGTSVLCPECQSTQEVVAPAPGYDPDVRACLQCQSNLILVPSPSASDEHPGVHQSRRPVQGEHSGQRAVPRSALIAMGGLTVLLYLGVGILMYGASYGVKQLPPYKASESFVRQHPVLRERLGEPLTPGWFPAVRMQTRGRKGSALIELTVSGSRGSGRVAVTLDGELPEWHIREARYQVGETEAKPLWVQFPGDVELLDQLETMMTELDSATNARDVDGMMKHMAPDASFRFIDEQPPARQVRTFRNRDEFRRETLAEILRVQHVNSTRRESAYRLAPDGRSAVGKFLWTHEIVARGRSLTYSLDETIRYSLEGERPLIVSVDGVRQWQQQR